MTLIKSLLLGSAAGIVAVATAQAADLPTRKAAPVEYVRVCNVGGITGWTLPGSDTCVKFSGYMTAHYIGGNLSNQYNDATAAVGAAETALNPFAPTHSAQTLMVQGGDTAQAIFNGSAVPITIGGTTFAPGAKLGVTLPNQQNATFNRDSQGWNIRANFGFDLASNTAYGPLIGHFDLNSDLGSGLDSPRGSFTYVN
jgi:Porin subfamily